MRVMQSELTLEYETAHFIHLMLGGDLKVLEDIREGLEVELVSREGWIRVQGRESDVQTAQRMFDDLEKAVRGGNLLSPREVKLAMRMARENNGDTIEGMMSLKLLGLRGRKPIVARTPTQYRYLKIMEEESVVFGLGPAGTGKTYLAMAMALSMLKAHQIRKIVLTRPAVEAGEALGFLPGDLREKVAPYLRPLYDAIHDMMGAEEGNRLMEEGIIEIAPLAFMRGRTLSRSFVILDEAQNTTKEQMFMFLTRLGEDSRCVVTGDGSQVDLKPGVTSGLKEAEAALQGVRGISFVRFHEEDVVRHAVVQRIIAAYRKHRGD